MLDRHTLPPLPTFTIRRLATDRPAVTLRFDALGLGSRHGHAVTKPGPSASVAVTLSTTELVEPGSASSGRPSTLSSTVPPAATAPVGAPTPARVSSRRTGSVPWNAVSAGK